MSLNSEISTAATEAQAVLAQLGGADADTPNALYNGTTRYAVYGTPFTEDVLLAGGGTRRRVLVPASTTRAQYVAPPLSGRQWVRTDLDPQVTYTIKSVGTHDSTVYTLVLLRVGD